MSLAFPNLRRFVAILHICARHIAGYAITQKAQRWHWLRQLHFGDHLSGPQHLRMALQEIGGTFIKFGQVLALQSDLLPLDYCKELFNLLDRVPPFPFEDVQRTFVQDFGRSPDEIFDTFTREPIATGSIGQVHVASRGAEKLAVKVRRPSVMTDFGSDIHLMILTVRVIQSLRIKRMYWMIAPTSEFVSWTREELDYRSEARYMDMIARNAAGNPQEGVPRVLWEYTTERILTTGFLEGLTLLDFMRARETGDQATLHGVQASGLDPDIFARNLIDNFLGDAFQYGMFHADLHPANLFILPSNKVGYIDFGIAGVLSTYSRQHLVAMTLAYARGDLKHMCDSFFRVSAMDERSNPEAFRSSLSEMSREWYVRNESGVMLRKSITAIMLDLLTLSRSTGIWPQRDVVKYIRSAIALDGLIKSFAPGFNVGHHLEIVCERHLRWHGLRNLLSPGSVLGWLEANVHLARDGMWRAARVADQFGSTHARRDPARTPRRQSNPTPALRPAILAFATAALVALPRDSLAWGWNPRSVGLVFAALAALSACRKLLHEWHDPENSGSGRQFESTNLPG
jgi:ubiquinone biosynthesis protein